MAVGNRPETSRRRNQRISVDWPVEWTVAGIGYNGVVRDTTGEGFFLEPEDRAVEVAKRGDRIELQLRPPDLEPVDASGVIVWVGASLRHRCAGFGVRLLEPPAALTEHVRRLRDA